MNFFICLEHSLLKRINHPSQITFINPLVNKTLPLPVSFKMNWHFLMNSQNIVLKGGGDLVTCFWSRHRGVGAHRGIALEPSGTLWKLLWKLLEIAGNCMKCISSTLLQGGGGVSPI